MIGEREHPQPLKATAELPQAPLGLPSSKVPKAALASLTRFGWGTSGHRLPPALYFFILILLHRPPELG